MSARFLVLLPSFELLIRQQIKLNLKGGARLYSEQITPSAQSQVSKYWWAVKYVCSPCDVGVIQTFPRGGLIKGFHCYQVKTTPLHLFFLTLMFYLFSPPWHYFVQECCNLCSSQTKHLPRMQIAGKSLFPVVLLGLSVNPSEMRKPRLLLFCLFHFSEKNPTTNALWILALCDVTEGSYTSFSLATPPWASSFFPSESTSLTKHELL